MNLPTGVTGYALIGLGVALAASLAANAAVGRLWLAARDDLAFARSESAQNAAQAKQCSDGVASLQSAAERRAALAEGARDAAMALATQAQKRATSILTKPPAVPGNDCASARAQVDDWLAGRPGATK